MESIISLQNVSKRFDHSTVLNNINLSIKPGTVVGLLGPNGAGKSTLMQLVLGMLKADSGTSMTLRDDSWAISEESKSRIGYVAQEPMFFEWMTVQQSVDYLNAFYPKWDNELVERLLILWELSSDKKIKHLSVGQKQRLAIVHALAHQPELLILDEPVASLDPLARRQFIQQLIEVNLDRETTILFSTHIVTDIERVCSDVIFLNKGEIKYQGELDALKENVTKVTLSSEQVIPAECPFENSLSYRVDGHHATAIVNERDISELPNIELTKQKLDLENLYLELMS